ncbi:MAG: hypothetical protein ACE5I8_02860 [Thermodesulfobacteriota bacterium]
MDSKEKTKKDDKSTEAGSGFPSGDCQAMFEKMIECCGDMSELYDCCSMMGKMKDKKSAKSKRE